MKYGTARFLHEVSVTFLRDRTKHKSLVWIQKIPFNFYLNLALLFLYSIPVLFAGENEVRPLFKQTPELIISESIEGVNKLSGVAWLPKEDHFLFSSAKPAALHEIAVVGKGVRKIRTIKLKEFNGLSAVAYVGQAESGDEGNRIALTEEGKAEVSFCDITERQGELKRSQCKTYKIDRLMFWEKKFGIKGLAVNRDSDVPIFYFGKEKMPKEISRGFFEDGQWHMQTAWDAESMMPMESVISDLFYDNSLFVLDGAGARVLQMDPLTGQTVSEFHIKKDHKWGLSGFCLARHEDGTEAVLASDKNHYYIYNISDKSPPAKTGTTSPRERAETVGLRPAKTGTTSPRERAETVGLRPSEKEAM